MGNIKDLFTNPLRPPSFEDFAREMEKNRPAALIDFGQLEARVLASLDSESVHAAVQAAVLPMQKIADDIHDARVASRELYTNGLITLEQYKIQKELLDNNVLTHIHWYKTYNPKFNELEFVAASGDGSAVF